MNHQIKALELVSSINTISIGNSKNMRAFVDNEGGIWFCLRDVLEAMGSSTPPSVAKRSVIDIFGDGVIQVNPIQDTLGRMQNVAFAHESATTYLIANGNTEASKNLNKKIHAEILPELRKTGRYELAPKTEAEKLLEAFSILTNQVETEKALRLEAERTKAMIGDKKVATALVTASHAVRRANKAEAAAEAAKIEAEKAKEAEKKAKRRALKFATLSDDLEEEVDKLKAKLEEVTIKEETFKAVTAIPWLKNYFLTLNNLTLQQIGKRLSSISRESDLETGEVQHERYGVAKTYHPKAISKFKALMDADQNLLGNYRK